MLNHLVQAQMSETKTTLLKKLTPRNRNSEKFLGFGADDVMLSAEAQNH